MTVCTGVFIKTYDRYLRRNPVILYFYPLSKKKQVKPRVHYTKDGWKKVYNCRNMRKFKRAINESNPDYFPKSLDKWTMLLYGINHELNYCRVDMDEDFRQGNWIITCLLIRGLFYKTQNLPLSRLFEEDYDEYLLHAVVGLPSGLLPRRFVKQVFEEYQHQATIKGPIRDRLPLAVAMSVGASRDITDQLMVLNPYAISQRDADGLVPADLAVAHVDPTVKQEWEQEHDSAVVYTSMCF